MDTLCRLFPGASSARSVISSVPDSSRIDAVLVSLRRALVTPASRPSLGRISATVSRRPPGSASPIRVMGRRDDFKDGIDSGPRSVTHDSGVTNVVRGVVGSAGGRGLLQSPPLFRGRRGISWQWPRDIELIRAYRELAGIAAKLFRWRGDKEPLGCSTSATGLIRRLGGRCVLRRDGIVPLVLLLSIAEWLLQRLRETASWACDPRHIVSGGLNGSSGLHHVRASFQRGLAVLADVATISRALDQQRAQSGIGSDPHYSRDIRFLSWEFAALHGSVLDNCCVLFSDCVVASWATLLGRTNADAYLVKRLSEEPSRHIRVAVDRILVSLNERCIELGGSLTSRVLPCLVQVFLRSMLRHLRETRMRVNRQGAWTMLQDLVYIREWAISSLPGGGPNRAAVPDAQTDFDDLPYTKRWKLICLCLMRPELVRSRAALDGPPIADGDGKRVTWYNAKHPSELDYRAELVGSGSNVVRDPWDALPDAAEWVKLCSSNKHLRVWRALSGQA